MSVQHEGPPLTDKVKDIIAAFHTWIDLCPHAAAMLFNSPQEYVETEKHAAAAYYNRELREMHPDDTDYILLHEADEWRWCANLAIQRRHEKKASA